MAKKKTKKKVGWGGVRPGAGAKPKGEGGKIVSTYLYPADQVALDRVRVTLGVTKNEAVRRAINALDQQLSAEVVAPKGRRSKKS